MSLTNRLYIDTKDAYAEYGLFAVRGAFDEFLKLPKAKARIQNDWGDQNGLDIDSSKTYLQNRDITVPFCLAADDTVDFAYKRQALLTALAADGLRSFQVPELGFTFSCLYVENTEFKMMSRHKKHNKVFARVSIKLTTVDSYPTAAEPTYRSVIVGATTYLRKSTSNIKRILNNI